MGARVARPAGLLGQHARLLRQHVLRAVHIRNALLKHCTQLRYPVRRGHLIIWYVV